ncbi:hypothetical protein [Psittacicella hinzii]|uniref:Uncharacterized protein n=1 Tax=Psittacicella hinzii TaxID=2028575 RepID=A0A3A1YLK5_9GAMM|nr:hypothetical protein [Psittacicella hinzii]RIY39173.1 hypothetical protein CKF58_02725 [Psittacicella hinzii]
MQAYHKRFSGTIAHKLNINANFFSKTFLLGIVSLGLGFSFTSVTYAEDNGFLVTNPQVANPKTYTPGNTVTINTSDGNTQVVHTNATTGKQESYWLAPNQNAPLNLYRLGREGRNKELFYNFNLANNYWYNASTFLRSFYYRELGSASPFYKAAYFNSAYFNAYPYVNPVDLRLGRDYAAWYPSFNLPISSISKTIFSPTSGIVQYAYRASYMRPFYRSNSPYNGVNNFTNEVYGAGISIPVGEHGRFSVEVSTPVYNSNKRY